MRANRAVLIMVRTLDGVYQPITDFTNFDNFFFDFSKPKYVPQNNLINDITFINWNNNSLSSHNYKMFRG